ncbi:NAD(P)/FAD-dependent oxidoreductase [Pseudoruegeria sp. SHC-113]|uniref:NAD(P)/FAD-dependent oxidoreductase n=1 Tax=Pseudoruegeria sp. SHC-113 TaxID=2855439 RepID=UPI0021BAE8C6|nr:NAD(P)/FAD-dependent oxidoreductase [Pseudoruegeria sp. SHC-113]MCT8158818.1 NAD(P)/FAD-dependent oxidoreductase [Pseudoruegeria sp. SHC-113]
MPRSLPNARPKPLPEALPDCDVLIVGGGPAGLSVASALPPQVRSVIVHQDKEIGLPVRTSGVSWLADVQALGLPEACYHPIYRTDIYSDHETAHFEITSHTVVALDVTATYRHLASLSEDHERRLLLNTKYRGSRHEGGQIVSRLRTPEGEKTLRARYLVDASGWHCAALQSLGLAQPPRRRAVGIEYEYPLQDMDPHRVVLFFGRHALSAYGWALPTGAGTVRLGIGIIQPDSTASPKELMEGFLASGELERMGLPRPGDGMHVNAGILPSAPYERQLVYGNVIRVGDSANMATPTLGEGIRTAIASGRELGTALGAAVAGNETALARYERDSAKRYERNYQFGFLTNSRAAAYGPDDWDRAVRRIRRLDEASLAAAFRSEFTWPMIARTMAKSAWSKLRGRS